MDLIMALIVVTGLFVGVFRLLDNFVDIQIPFTLANEETYIFIHGISERRLSCQNHSTK